MSRAFIGCGAGFANDRTDAALPVVEALAKKDGPRFLIFETLAERTLAMSQFERRDHRGAGYNRALKRFVQPVLRDCVEAGIRIVSNFGAANPLAAALAIAEIAREQGCSPVRIAVVEGDDITNRLTSAEFADREVDGRILSRHPEIIAANVYLGAEPIAEALNAGADIVVTGRVADPSLTLGPLIHSLGWGLDDLDRIAAGTLAGHLLECGSQITGGYFADPGVKDVPGMDVLGYPIAEVEADGSFVITKPDGTGGLVDRRTVTEQILYEIHDPAAYLTPDVVLDITGVEIEEIGPDRVHVSGAKGKPKPETLKATVCINGGFLAEAEISYAGPNAALRARLAIDIIRKRMTRLAPELTLRADAIGLMSVHGDLAGTALADAWDDGPRDIRIRFAAQTYNAEHAELLISEVEALYCAGPAGGGGYRGHLTPRLVSASCLIERERVAPRVLFVGSDHE